MSAYTLTFGCDPELFVFDTVQGKYVTGHGLIPGTKENPYKVKGGAVQVDGMALEFNIDPATTPEQFAANIESVLTELKGMLPSHLKLCARPTVDFGKEYMDSMPDEAKELGCDPDFDAYKGGRENPRPNQNVTFRTTAGHLHIGWGEDFDVKDPDHIETCCMLAKFLDYTVGAVSALWDKDQERRSLYGNKGAFRPKPYGMEYRTPSSAWVANKDLWKAMPRLVQHAWNLAMDNGGVLPYSAEAIVSRVFAGEIIDSRTLHTILKEVGKVSLHSAVGEETLVTEDWKFSIIPEITSQWIIEDFEECKHLLDKAGVRWGEGQKPSEFDYKGYPVTLLAGSLLYCIPANDYQKRVTLADKWGEVTENCPESKYFV